MQGLWIEAGTLSYRDDLPRPRAARGACRLRLLAAGVCGTDLALARGYMGFRGIPGHEFVAEALDGTYAGRRVVGEINVPCGACDLCRADLPRHCVQRRVLGIAGLDGAFAEELVLPAQNLHPVPDAVSTEAATFTEPLAAAFEIAEQLDLETVERAVVVGDGRLGLLCAQVLGLALGRVDLRGHHPEHARRLPRELDCRWIAEPAPSSYDLVVEASGSQAGVAEALELVRPRGTLVQKSTVTPPLSVDLTPIVIDEVTLIGSRCGPFEPALEALAAGRVSVEALIDARLPLGEGRRAFEAAASSGIVKVLLTH